MSTWKIILATLVIFAAGLFTGAMVVKNSAKKPQNEPRPTVLRTDLLRRLTKDLGLSPEQRAKVDSILQESNERTKILREIVDPELRAEYKKAVEDIRAELKPKQRLRFDELLQKKRKSGTPGRERRGAGPTNTASLFTNLSVENSNTGANPVLLSSPSGL